MTTGFDYASVHPVYARLIEQYAHGAHVPHALLLLGDAGLPLPEFASYLACALLCTAKEHKPCLQCGACSRVLSGAHANHLTVGLAAKERSIKIEQVRDLLDALSLNPQEAGRRIIAIVGADTMTVQAQNALLKAIEEPQPQDYFVLTTSNERAILPTISSRCQVARLTPWADRHVQAYLRAQGVSEDRSLELTAISRGYPSAALQMDQGDQYTGVRTLMEQTFLAVRQPAQIPDASAKLKDARDDTDALLMMLEEETHRVLLQAMEPSPHRGGTHPWQDASPEALTSMLHQIYQARQYRASNVSWQSIADRLLLTITKEIHQCQW